MAGAVDYFLKLDGIKGESQDDKHKGEIDLQSWGWGATQAATTSYGGGGGAGKVSVHDLTFTHYLDTASPQLMLVCSNGQHIKTGLLTCRKAGKDALEYFTIEMTEILVTSWQVGGHEGSSILPSEQISLSFSKFLVKYTPQKADGSGDVKQQAGWDLKLNKVAT
jgi:type VI secretion system secreted protein Hcp